MNKLVITAALTGAEVTREQQPALPISPEEIAHATWECAQAGAAIVHVHARNPDGSSTQSAQSYRAISEAVRARCDVIVQVSTGGAVGMSSQERLQPVTLRPEMATLSMGSVNFGDDVFMNPPQAMATFRQAMQDHGVCPEYEVFDAGQLATLQRWVQQGLVRLPLHVDLVLGVPGAMPATPQALMYLLSHMPSGATWTVAAVGAAQLQMHGLALALGGHVRVGFEDNIYLRKGVKASSNAQFVERIAAMGRLMDRPPATPDDVRLMLGIGKSAAD